MVCYKKMLAMGGFLVPKRITSDTVEVMIWPMPKDEFSKRHFRKPFSFIPKNTEETWKKKKIAKTTGI